MHFEYPEVHDELFN